MAKRGNKKPAAPSSTAVETPERSDLGDDCVIVALNRPQGIIFRLKGGRQVEVHGNAVHLRGKEMGVLPTGGAFGLTPVARSDWEEIKRVYGNTALFKGGRIFAQASRSEALEQAEDHAKTRHGLEPTKGQVTGEIGREAVA